MLLDSRPDAPARKPKATQASPAPVRVPADVSAGADDVRRLLSFAPPRFDPNAVASARAQLETALKPVTAPDEVDNPMGLRLGAGTSFNAEASAASGRGLSDSFSDTESTARDQLAEALRSQRREAIGLNDPASDKRDKPVRMTPEQYAALGPRQKQAVDFNTALVAAVRRDRKNQGFYEHSSQEQRDRIDQLEKDMFGEDRGSDMLAPETLGVLKQIGFSDPNADLDDFLSLKAGIHARDLKDLAGPEPTVEDAMRAPEPTQDSPEQDRLDLSRMLAAKTGTMQRALAKGQSLLQTINATATADRASLVSSLGGNPAKPAQAPGFGGTPRDQWFQQLFDSLAHSDSDVKFVLDTITLEHPEDLQDFRNFAAARVSNAERFGERLLSDGMQSRTPEEIRRELGLEEGR